jgi:hypothetical protein
MQTHVIETDFLVAGGGMAGVCAAIAAAREGAKVVLVQDRSVLGGNASSEVRMHIVGADNHGGRKGWRESGLIEELRLEDAVRNPERCYPLWDQTLYEKVIAEPNITLLLDTDVVGVEMESAATGLPLQRTARTERMYEFNGPRGVRIKCARAVRNLTQDEFVIFAKQFADCTGDGRLGFEAGADFRIGRESKAMHGEAMAVDVDDVHTLGSSILITSRDAGRPVPFAPPPWARKFSPEKLGIYRNIKTWEYGFWWVEWGGHLDSIKDGSTTIRHELFAIALGLWDYVKNSGRFKGSETWTLDWIGAIPGKRESRRFLGPHVLTQQDCVNAPVFRDEVAYGGWSIDLHPVRGIDQIDEPPCTQVRMDQPFGIPLRCFFSRNVSNLFFAGRDISATHVAFASTRVMATCAVGGQAVGVAAAHCARLGVDPAQVIADDATLAGAQQTLLRQDATLLNTRLAKSKIHDAALTASSAASGFPVENVRDGLIRDEFDSKTGELIRGHGWRSAPLSDGQPQWVELRWERPTEVREVAITFDTGFQRELTLSASDYTTSKVVRGPQPETVKGYTIEVNGDVVVTVADNFQRQRVHRFPKPVVARSLRIELSATHGVPEARILEIAVR